MSVAFSALRGAAGSYPDPEPLPSAVSALLEDDIPNNVEYVLLAEFDIDKGSTVRHQYPKPCPVSAGILADLMLPEGAHLRPQDWTIFFLRAGESAATAPKRRKTKVDKWRNQRLKLKRDIDDLTASVQVLEWSESAQDWFIFNEVALLKVVYSDEWNAATSERLPVISLTIVDIENPVDVIRRAEINDDIQFTVLSDDGCFCSFYPTVGNAVGLKFLEPDSMKKVRSIITEVLMPPKKPSDDDGMGVDFGAGQEPGTLKPGEQLVCLNVVRTDKDESVKRGAVVKALGLVTRLQILESFKPLLVTALDHYFRSESETGLSFLYVTLNKAIFDYQRFLEEGPVRCGEGGRGTMVRPTPGKSPATGLASMVAGGSGGDDLISETFVVPVTFHRINMNLIVPINIGPDEITGVSVTRLLNTFMSQIPLIYNAVATMKRVLFLGHNQPANFVCDCVLAACLLTSPSLRGTLKRAYPYACLTSMDFLSTDGYIAGVTNPIFETREEWWDVCCNVSTGVVRCSEKYRSQLDSQPLYAKTLAADRKLVAQLKDGVTHKYSEKWIRSVIDDYTDHWSKMGLNEEVFGDEAKERRDKAANEWRLEQWRKTTSYAEACDRQIERSLSSPFEESTLEMEKIVRTMQMRVVGTEDAHGYMQRINDLLTSEARIDYFLDLMRPSLGGLSPLVTFLYHSDYHVKEAIIMLLRNIETNSKLGKRMIQALNFFFIMTYERLKLESSRGSLV